MKVVIIAGGKGQEYLSIQNFTKPMIKIGSKPILEHIEYYIKFVLMICNSQGYKHRIIKIF